MSLTTTKDQMPDNGATNGLETPGGPAADDAVHQMDNPHRARSIKDVLARVTMWGAFFVAKTGP